MEIRYSFCELEKQNILFEVDCDGFKKINNNLLKFHTFKWLRIFYKITFP